MTFQRHELLGNRPVLKGLAIASGLGVVASILVGASTNSRTFGDTQCVGMITEYVDPNTPVYDVVTDYAEKFNINPADFNRILLNDNKSQHVFTTNSNNELVFLGGEINVAKSCS